MRTSLFIALIALQCAPAAAAELAVNNSITRVVPSIKHLRDLCAADGTYDACTLFVAYRLDATCGRATDGWRLSASGRMTPYIALYNIRHLGHERDHIDDVAGSLRRYFAELEREAFASEAACRDAGARAMEGFSGTIRVFAAASNASRHPALLARK